jgi:hypothetical protein
VPDISPSRYALGLLAVAIIAALLRLSYVFRSDFPLNDGALFYSMIQDIQANGYTLPPFTSFDNAGIPFGYPPLTLFATALINEYAGLSLVEALRWLPFLGSMVSVVAFMALARSFLNTRLAALTASLFFSMLGPGFTWMLMGGGITRAWGLAFCVLTIWQAHEMYRLRSWKRAAVVAVLAAATLTTHLEMAWLAAFTCAIFFAAYGRHREGARATIFVAVAVPVLTAPWWATVIGHHGVAPFRAALDSGSNPFVGPLLLIQYNIAVEPLFALVGALGLLGALACIARRQYVLPLWLVAVALLDPRAFPTSSTMALALLASVALHDLLIPVTSGALSGKFNSLRWPASPHAPAALTGIMAAVIVCYAILSAFITSPKLLTGLTPDERAAMAWAAENTPQGATFAVLTGDGWAVDRTSEWFPVLSGRESIATVQGWEWVPGQYHPRQAEYDSLQDCALENGDCLLAWAERWNRTFDYVYVTTLSPRVPSFERRPCCTSLRVNLPDDPRFVSVYEGPGATIYRVDAAPSVSNRSQPDR